MSFPFCKWKGVLLASGPQASPRIPALRFERGLGGGTGCQPGSGPRRGPHMGLDARRAGRAGLRTAPLTNLSWNLFSFCLKLFNEMRVICGGSLSLIFVVSNFSNEVENRTALRLHRQCFIQGRRKADALRTFEVVISKHTTVSF